MVYTEMSWASPVAQMVKNLAAMQETQVQSPGQEDPLKNETATHSSTLAWKIHGWRKLAATAHGVAKSQKQLSDFTFFLLSYVYTGLPRWH